MVTATVQAHRLGAAARITRSIGTRARNLQQKPAARQASLRFLRSAAASAEPEVAEPVGEAVAEAPAPAAEAPAAEAPAARATQQRRQQQRGGRRQGGPKPLIGPERTLELSALEAGKYYDGAVVSITDFGAFVNIGAQTDGLLHISQISAAFVRDVREAVSIGQPISVRVINVDMERGKFAVTAIPEGQEPVRSRDREYAAGEGGGPGGPGAGRQQERPRQARVQKQRGERKPLLVAQGDNVTAPVVSVVPFGVFIDIGNGYNGMLHSSQMKLPEGVTDHVGHFKAGDEVAVRVVRVERNDKVALTMKSEEELAAEEKTRTKGLATTEVDVPEGTNGLAFLLAKAGIKSEQFTSRSAPPAAAPVTEEAVAPVEAEVPQEVVPAPLEEVTEEVVEVPNGSAHAVEAAAAPAAVPEAPAAAAGGISAAAVKQLRDASGAGMMDCKKALAECNGNLEEAKDFLRKKGLASADKKAGRVAAEGAVWSYIHAGSRLGVLVEVNCETDFVGRGEKFQELVNDIAMQIAACPAITVVSAEDVPAEVLERERAIEMQKEDLASKPEAIRSKIVQGRVDKIAKEMALLEQPFIKDTGKTVGEVVKESVATIGENIQIRRFARYVLGEGIELADKGDFAAEVEAQSAAMAAKAAEKKQEKDEAPAAAAKEEAKPAVAVSAAVVKQLRDASGAGMMDCKKALAECNGDLEEAKDFLRKKGLASADKKAGRVAAEGAIGAYIHAGSRLGVLVEVNCETDFVARGEKFRELVNDIAMQIAACPDVRFVSASDVPAEVLERERAIEMQKEDLASKPEAIRSKIVQGRVDKIAKEMALLEQPFIKDTGKTVAEHIKGQIASIGENMGVRRFDRYVLGELVEKKVTDFAAEVAAQTGAKL